MTKKKKKVSQREQFSSKERTAYGKKILREEHNDMIAARMMSEFYGEDVLDATDLNESFQMFTVKNKQKKTKTPLKKNKSIPKGKKRRKKR